MPDGITNLVTQVGMDELLAEKQLLIDERDNLDIASESEKRIAVNHINTKLQLLNNRIIGARVVNLKEQPQDEVRFGALVTLKIGAAKKLQKYQIVGVDEANISKGRISFVSPVAKILMAKKVGDKAVLELARENRVFKILGISYP
ncbi:MAG: GreA/GreB family elongation factor [Saprospiraceae bacterium]|nr:GreA/GreB family elongation factor [Saprospiraceae bacterium]